METWTPLASALGLGVLAGARLYATVFALGLLIRCEWMTLPAGWRHAAVLGDTRVLIVAGVACAVEFIADKIPWMDSAWDSIHTFIRPIGAVLLTSSLFAHVDPIYQALLFLVAGGAALSGHSAKAATRLVVNHSPEPFSNVALSLTEDAVVAGGLYLAVKHPWLTAGLALAFLALVAWLAPRLYRSLRAELAAFAALLRSWFGGVRPPLLSPDQQNWLDENLPGAAARSVFAVVASADLKGMRNITGTLCLADHEAVFFYRKWGRPVKRRIGPLLGLKAVKGLPMDDLVLITSAKWAHRFGLLAGQFERAQAEVQRRAPPPPQG